MSYQFKLSEDFVKKFEGKQPQWGYGALGYITYKRTYARNLPNGNTEEFWQTLERVVNGVFNTQKEHCERLGLIWDNRRAQRSAQVMFQKMWDFKFLPPGRGLWGMGTEALKVKGSAMLQNCGFVSTEEINHDLATPFCWAMDMLFLGVGIGFDLLGAGKVTIKQATISESTFIIPDTREGWIEAVRMILEAFESGKGIPTFDYSQIRKIGEPIKTFGGVSSGSKPLELLLTSIINLLSQRVGQKILSTDILDIMNFIGRCAVSGNVRRSAELALGSPEDKLFIDAKNPETHASEMMSHRWASNNSVIAEIGMDYAPLAALTAKNGEPGYIWLGNTRAYSRMKDEPDFKDAAVKGFNPCAEQPLENFELCNLVEVFPHKHENVEEFYDTLKYAYMYAKTVTLIPTHEPRTNAVLLRNRRIGCSLSGIEQAKKKFGISNFYHKFCDEGYKIIKNWDKVYSNWLCIPRSIKVTTVKPSGTVSLLVGATPGVHAAHSEYYLRTIRLSHNSPIVTALIQAGYRVEYGATEWKEGLIYSGAEAWDIVDTPEDDCNDFYHEYLNIDEEVPKELWSRFIYEHPLNIVCPPLSNFEGTVVAYFPIKEENFSKGKAEQTLWEQMDNTAQMQHFWSDNGVSATITFKKSEIKDIQTVLEHYENRLKAISLFPEENHGYAQPPYASIDKYIYGQLTKGLKPLNLDIINASDKKQDNYCDGQKCEIK